MEGGYFINLEKYIFKIQEDMTSLQVYRKEYDPIIRIYCSMLLDFDLHYEEYADSGFALNISLQIVEDGNTKEINSINPVIKHLENLRKDIKEYSNILGLNVKADKNSIIESSVKKFDVMINKRKKIS